MKVSSRLDYAMSCVLRVADQYDSKRPVTAREISKKEKIAAEYAEQLLTKLKRSGVVRSVRGVKGGYILSDSPSRIKTTDVVRTFDKDILTLVCYRPKGRRGKCIHYDDCKIRFFWLGLKDDMETYFDHYDLGELLKKRREEKNWKGA